MAGNGSEEGREGGKETRRGAGGMGRGDSSTGKGGLREVRSRFESRGNGAKRDVEEDIDGVHSRYRDLGGRGGWHSNGGKERPPRSTIATWMTMVPNEWMDEWMTLLRNGGHSSRITGIG